MRLSVSVSGGRTSAYMAAKIKAVAESRGITPAFIFANTGCEHPDTLRFVNDVDKHLNLNLVWVEAVVHSGRVACTHRVVSFDTASRCGEPFEAVVAKYGLPNQTFKLCTRELKLNPMNSYRSSIGWKRGTYCTAIGIRADETRRVAPSADAQNIVYPLVDWWPADKQDVLDYWSEFDWDLGISEHQGNCVTCYKKSDRKLLTLYREDRHNFDFVVRLDDLYKNVGPNNVPGPRKMFRGFRSARDIVAEFATASPEYAPLTTDGGCSESCELYEFVG